MTEKAESQTDEQRASDIVDEIVCWASAGPWDEVTDYDPEKTIASIIQSARQEGYAKGQESQQEWIAQLYAAANAAISYVSDEDIANQLRKAINGSHQ